MKRWLLLFAACSKDEPVREGVSRVHVHLEDTYLDLTYTLKLPAAPEPLEVNKAACQVGGDRFVTRVYSMLRDFTPNQPIEVEDHPFITEKLAGKPTLCELEIHGERFCMDEDRFTRGACKPNVVAGPAVSGLSARLESVKGEDRDSLGFPPHLTLYYVVTAHEDMPKGAYAVRSTSCGSGSDSTWHSEAEMLRAGESFRAGQNTYRLGRPAAGTRCKTTFGFSPVVDGPVTVVGEACHVDDKIVPCA